MSELLTRDLTPGETVKGAHSKRSHHISNSLCDNRFPSQAPNFMRTELAQTRAPFWTTKGVTQM